jgi:DNA invertase Pin-like site-specific DNA recombinase
MSSNVIIIPPSESKPDTLRVAAYCRVSSDSSDQLHSYAAQIRKYTAEIGSHEDWELVDIYADEGLTGTRMDKREDFNRMLSDCRKGRIDKVLVKSVSRFARNTKDCLAALRELMSLGVTVYFEKENINTETLTTELMVSVSGALAQQESISISQNQRISYKRRMERGEFITCTAPLGYRLVNGKNLEIIPEEAKLIRWIFESYLSGHSTKWIAARMTEQGIPTTWNRGVWHEQVIRKILANEKYIGDSLCQKTFTTDTFPYERKLNKGDADQYYTERSHPAIIEREAFERVQALMKKRAERVSNPLVEYPLSKKIICGECGSIFSRKQTKNGLALWVCRKHDRKAADCPIGRIPESEIYAAFVRMYNKLRLHEGVIITPALTQLQELNNALQRGNPAMLEINKAIAAASEQSYKVTALQSKGLLDAAVCSAKLMDIEARLAELRRERRRLLKNEDIEAVIDTLRQTANLIHSGPERLERFDEVLFSDLVEKITAESQTRIRFRLYGGIELTEQLREVGR